MNGFAFYAPCLIPESETNMSDSKRHIRDEVAGIPPYNSGLTLDEVRERYRPAVIAKLGSNENPFGASPHALASLGDLGDLFRLYPDPKGRALCAALAGRFGFDASQIILGNGSEDLIAVICRAVIRSGDTVTTLYPSFPLHEDYTVLMGGIVERIEVLPDLSIDVPKLIAAAKRKPRMLLFANPMNPVGSWIGERDFKLLLDAVDRDTLLVIDEAYAEYAYGGDYPATIDILKSSGKSWVILRTFSKAYGLAGLRIGFGVASDTGFCDFLNRVRTPFNTSAIAQAAAIAALGDEEHLERAVTLALSERARVTAALEEMGFKVARSKGNFVFFDCKENASAYAETLLAAGVIVKPWKQSGYETFLRVSVGSVDENDHFLQVLAKGRHR
jgi:histidinol-phosphate aminotransferase